MLLQNRSTTVTHTKVRIRITKVLTANPGLFFVFGSEWYQNSWKRDWEAEVF